MGLPAWPLAPGERAPHCLLTQYRANDLTRVEFFLGKKVLALAAGLVPLWARLFQWGMSNGPYFN